MCMCGCVCVCCGVCVLLVTCLFMKITAYSCIKGGDHCAMQALSQVNARLCVGVGGYVCVGLFVDLHKTFALSNYTL